MGALVVAIWQALGTRGSDDVHGGIRACVLTEPRWCSSSNAAAMLAAGTSPRATMSGTSLSGTHSRRVGLEVVLGMADVRRPRRPSRGGAGRR